jgi:hypothetical protein
MGSDAQDMDRPGLDLHHEQDVHTLQQDGIDMQEITCQDSGRLSGQDPADRPLTDSIAKAEQLALDAPVPPARVLPGQLLHQLPHLV